MGHQAEQPPTEAATPNTAGACPPDRQLAFLEELLEEHATIAGDVLELGEHTWAIHGSVAVDGDVILAEFETDAQARMVLDELPGTERGTDHP